MKRRFLSMILCLTMLIGILPTGASAYGLTDNYNDEIQTYAGAADPDPNGDGTAENPYLITSASELMWFRDKVNSGEPSISARLMGDIRLDNADGWTPIGSDDYPYIGTFDGNNYSINTIIGKKWTMTSEDKSILFGYIGESGVIKSLNMRFQVIAADNAAVLSYENNGTIEQCTVETILENDEDTVSFCGFAYTNNGTIRNCLSILKANYNNVCGFVHTNNGTIENSICTFQETTPMSDDDSVYAIAKETNGTITNCYCTCEYHFGIVKDTDNVQKVYNGEDGLKYNNENGKAALLKKMAWLLNNNGSTEGDSTDPWRFGDDINGADHNNPTLNPTDQKVLSSDGSRTETPHTHRVDGVIREFVGGTVFNPDEYIFLTEDYQIVNGAELDENKTICLNGYNLESTDDSIIVPSGINFTVTDCQETAGTVTSRGSAVVIVDGGKFVLDNANISNCAVGIDYKKGTVKLSGKARVTDNTTNIKLAEGQKLTFGILDNSAHFGVTYGGMMDVGSEVEITDRTGAAYAPQLSSDNENYVIADGSNAVVLKHPEAHSHCVCGADHKEISGTGDDGNKTGHINEESVVFKPWNPNSHRDSENRPTLPTEAGSYYLTEDADLKGGAWEPSGDIKLCLNGHTVSFDHRKGLNGRDFGVAVLDEATDILTVTDCGETGTFTMNDEKQNCIRISGGATFNFYNGTMKGFERAVSIDDESTYYKKGGGGNVNIYGGILTENSYNIGSAIYANDANAKVTMYDGKIINNKTSGYKGSSRCGGGVCIEGGGTFTMYGGEISGNGQADTNVAEDQQYGAAYGGGVCVNGTFNMKGGKIIDNTATPQYQMRTAGGTTQYFLLDARGGGLYVSGRLNITGGEISNNTLSYGYGGGVYVSDSSTALIENATISGNTVKPDKKYNTTHEPVNGDGTRYYYGGLGGGIYSYNALTLKNTKIENNTLTNMRADANSYGGGAGIYLFNYDLRIENCNISGNTMTGKQINDEGAIGGAGVCVPIANLTIIDSEITDNTAISDSDAADGKKLVSGGVFFRDSKKSFTVSGNVNISGNTLDGSEGNVYLDKDRFNSGAQSTVTVGDTLASTSKIGLIAGTKADSGNVTAVTSANEIPDGIFTSDDSGYKAVLASDKKSVNLVVNNDVAEVIHTDDTKTGYADLYEAIQAAQVGETVKIIKDNCLINTGGYGASLNKDITLDLNNKTVKTDELIRITDSAAIKNGTIYGTSIAAGHQNNGSALITFQPTGNAPILTLDNAVIQEYKKSALALYVYNGKLIAKGGSIDGGLRVNSFGDAELSDITIAKDEEHTVYSGNDGVVFDMRGESDGAAARFLKSGYAYKKADGTFIDLSANPASIPIGTTVTVSKCTAHGFDSGKCKYCGYVCKHEHVDSSTCICTECGANMLAKTTDFGSDANKKWYITPEEAFASVEKGMEKHVVLYASEYTANDDIEIKGDVYYYPIIGDFEFKFANGKSFIVKNGGFFGGDGKYVGAVIVESGGGFAVQEGTTVGTLTVYDGSQTFINDKLQAGNFEKIVIQDGDKTLADIVHGALHKTFRYKGEDGTWASGKWATDEELGRQSIENVSIVEKPFYNEKITVSPEGELKYKNALNVTMSANKSDSTLTDYGETTYEWFATHTPATVLSTHPSYTTTLSVAGTYEFGCRITRGGYTRTVTKQITVNKDTSGYIKEPKAKEGLVYSGYEQDLIDAGTLSTDQKILYKLDDGDWSADIPKAADAGEYTVYYKVDENNNYYGIAEKNFKVTIAKKVLKDIVTDPIAKQYNGRDDLPTGFGIIKFTDSDNNELLLYGCIVMGKYESAEAGENKKVTIIVNLNVLEKNYVFDNGTAEKTFEKKGTINKAKAPYANYESLTIVRKLKRNYTFDVSKLLGDVPYGSTYGRITYELDSVDIPDFYDESDGKATIDENGILTLPIQESGSTDGGYVTVLATTDNYKGSSGEDKITLTIEIVSMAKIALKDGAPTLNPTSITYGQKLGDISLSGSFEDYDGNAVRGTFSWTNPDVKPNAGAASGDWIFTPDDEFYKYETRRGTANFTVEPKDIIGASNVTIGDFNLEYNGGVQTPTAAVIADGEVIDGVWSNVTNVSDKTTFTISGNYKGTIENITTNMKPKNITNAQITLAENPVYNGSEQTQGIASITIDGLTLSEGDYDIVSGNTATDVGEKTLEIQGKGNFSGNAEKKWSLKKKNYDGIKTASANVRYDKHMNITVELPEIPSGASYGTVNLSRAKNADGTDYAYSIFPSGQRGIEGNILYITVDPSQPGVYADITVPVIGAANYNDYEITVRLTCVDRKTVTFGGVDDNQTFVYDGTAKAPNIDGLTVSDNVDKNTLSVKYAKVTESGAADISANEITEVGTYKVTYSVPDTNNGFMGSITYTFTIEPKAIGDAVITLAESHEYNGSEQTQTIASVKIGEMTLSESDYDISENKATDVKADGNYVLTVTGKGNFSGTKTAEWNIKPTVPTENADKKTTARVRKGKTLASATVSNGEMIGVIPGEVLSGSFEWVDDTIVMNQNGTAQIKFKPDNTNYKETIFNVDVSTYSSGKGGSSSSSVTSYTVKFDTNGGSKISSVSVSENNTVKEPASPEKDGYKFDGWYTDKNLKNKYDFSTKVVKNFTLYAAWVKIETEPDPDPTDKPTNPDTDPTDKPTNPDTENLFDDVEKDDWYYDDVTDAVKKGLFNGTGSKIFDPNGIITRGMFVTVLYRSEGEPAVNKSISFEDISKDSYYANAVIWAEQNEIVNGISETEFAPNQNITREQIATIMFRFAKYKGYDVTQGGMKIREFEDYESISDYALSAMTWAVNTGLMKGKTESFINPHDSATRAEVAAILNRFLKSEK